MLRQILNEEFGQIAEQASLIADLRMAASALTRVVAMIESQPGMDIQYDMLNEAKLNVLGVLDQIESGVE